MFFGPTNQFPNSAENRIPSQKSINQPKQPKQPKQPESQLNYLIPERDRNGLQGSHKYPTVDVVIGGVPRSKPHKSTKRRKPLKTPSWKFALQLPDKPALIKRQNLIDKSFYFPIDYGRPQRQFDVSTIKSLTVEERASTVHSDQVAEFEEELAAFYPQ